MTITNYNIGTKPWDGVGDKITKDDCQSLSKGEGQGFLNRLKSSDDTGGNATDLAAIDDFYGHESFSGRQQKFGRMFDRMRLESLSSDSQPQIELAVKLIAEKLQELEELVFGELFYLDSTDTGGETGSSPATLSEAINPLGSQAVSSTDQAVESIAGMLQHIEEISPGFIDALKGDLSVTVSDDTSSDQVALLELLEELYEQVDLDIDRITAGDSAGQSDEIDQLKALSDGVGDAIAGLRERIASQINQIEALAPGFASEVKPFVEGDLADGKEPDPNQVLHDALEELSELLEDVVALLSSNVAEDNLEMTDSVEGNETEAATSRKVRQNEAAEAHADSVPTQEDNIMSAASNDSELESEAVEVFIAIYDQLSNDAKSEVAHILAGLAFEEEMLS
jgi:hypothetical protein